MTPKITVKKANGSVQILDYEKINQMIEWACEGLEDVSVSQIAMNAHIQFYDGIPTSEIQKTLIHSAADLISDINPGYQYAAAKLFLVQIYKEVYGSKKTHPNLYDHIVNMVNKEKYDHKILESFTFDEINELSDYIDYSRDTIFKYAGLRQLYDKYLIQDRTNGQHYETPQQAYMTMAMTFYMNDDKYNRIQFIKDFYDVLSKQDISLPTPIMGGVRGNIKQFASCALIRTGDSLKSINAASDAAVLYGSKRAGLGIDIGEIRPINSKVRDGSTAHTGIIPFVKYMLASLKSCSQGGIRGTAATMFYPYWHMEIENLLVLKNNRGTEETRVRHSDYSLKVNRLFYKRFVENKNITLFNPKEVPELYESFHNGDNDTFESLYETYEKSENISKKTIPAKDLFEAFIIERSSTGRIYLTNIDHMNTHSSFNSILAPIHQSNLCTEISLPTKPFPESINDGYKEEIISVSEENKYEVNKLLNQYGFLPKKYQNKLYRTITSINDIKNNDINQMSHANVEDDSEAEMALCILAAINLGNITDIHDGKLENICNILVRTLDNLIDYQEYPVKAAEISAKFRRTLGIGVTNLAYFYAKRGLRYSDGSANKTTHQLFEAIQYYLLKASNKLAKERGVCEKFNETKYAQGILPIDTYNKNVDEVCSVNYQCDWEELREEILTHGLRHSTLTAIMPCETSSKVTGSTNGIEPPKDLLSDKDGVKIVVPEVQELFADYECLWEIKNNTGYLTLVSIMQKFVDQAISCNTHYDPSRYSNKKVPIKIMMQDVFYAYKMGIKTLYYHYTNDNYEDSEDNLPELQTVDSDDDCDTCHV